MSQTREQCPVCFDFLETKEIAPCMDCGHFEEEIEHALSGKHTYAELRIFGDLTLVLCNFCMVDFGSYHPDFFGLPPKKLFENSRRAKAKKHEAAHGDINKGFAGRWEPFIVFG